MPPVPKSPEECKKELLETFGMIFAAGGEGRVMPSEEAISVVRSSLASLLMHAEGEIKNQIRTRTAETPTQRYGLAIENNVLRNFPWDETNRVWFYDKEKDSETIRGTEYIRRQDLYAALVIAEMEAAEDFGAVLRRMAEEITKE